MQQIVKAIVFESPGKIGLSEFELGACSPGSIVVRTLYTMVSTGTELRVLAGHYGSAGNFPFVPGYSVIGKVTQVGADVKGFRVGDLISGRNPQPLPGIKSQWGGQASHHVYVTQGENRPVLLPEGANPMDYLVAEIAGISLRGVVAAKPKAGQTGVVLGQGIIGAFSAAWLNAKGCKVIVADMEQGRLDRALKWGAAAAVNMRDADAVERIQQWCDGGADIVIETSGSIKGAETACNLVRRKPQEHTGDYQIDPLSFHHDWSKLVFQANYLEKMTIDPFNFFPGEGVVILAPMDHGIEDRQSSIEAFRRGDLRASDFIQRIVPFSEAPEAYIALRDDRNANFSLAFDWTSLG